MNWTNIGAYLARFKNILPPKTYKEETIKKCFRNLFSFDLKDEFFEIRNDILYLKKIGSAQKNLFFINQEKIIKELESALGRKAPKEIRFQ